MSAVHLGFFNTANIRTHVRFQFTTHASAGGNVAPNSAFEAADVRIYRADNGGAFSATQRSSAAGITMTSPFDSLTGFHDVDIDLADNTDAGFYAPGYTYSVVLAPDETVDGQTITAKVLAYFEVGTRDGIIDEGTALGATATTLQLRAAANFADDTLIGATIVVFGSTQGYPQVRVITDNALSGDSVTVPAWTVTPSGTITYKIFATAPGAALADFATAVWAATPRTLTALDEDSTSVDLDAAVRAAVGLASANLDTQIADIEGKVDDLETRIGTPSNLGGGATIAANLSDIEAQTDDIGALGAGLSAVPWNPAWDAEVQSEVQDALNAAMADSIPADGSMPSISQALYMLVQFMNERQVVGTTVNVMKPDGSTVLFTLLLNSALSPTTITRQT